MFLHMCIYDTHLTHNMFHHTYIYLVIAMSNKNNACETGTKESNEK